MHILLISIFFILWSSICLYCRMSRTNRMFIFRHILGLMLLVCLPWPCQNSASKVFQVYTCIWICGEIQNDQCIENECNYVTIMIGNVKMYLEFNLIYSLGTKYVMLVKYNCKLKKLLKAYMYNSYIKK